MLLLIFSGVEVRDEAWWITARGACRHWAGRCWESFLDFFQKLYNFWVHVIFLRAVAWKEASQLTVQDFGP